MEAGVPQESILQAYQAQQQIQEDAKRVMQDPSLTQEQRAQSLQQMQTQAQQTLQQLFGDKANQVLQRLQGNPATRSRQAPQS
jgi:membrane protein involved in colicin uptake